MTSAREIMTRRVATSRMAFLVDLQDSLVILEKELNSAKSSTQILAVIDQFKADLVSGQRLRDGSVLPLNLLFLSDFQRLALLTALVDVMAFELERVGAHDVSTALVTLFLEKNQ